MDAGNADTPTSMAGAIYTKLNATFGVVTAAEFPGGDDYRKQFCQAIAEAVVEHLDAQGNIRIRSADGGLQRDSTSAATSGPAADVVLTGALE